MLTINLSNKYIRAVEGDESGGKLHISRMYHAVDAGGAILNGTIVDAEALSALLKEFWDTNRLPKRNVHLVIDSNQFTAKEMQLPAMNAKKTLEYLQREFTGVERIENPVYGYFPLGKPDKVSKLQKVSVMAAPRNYIQQFVDLFAGIGVTLDAVESGRGVLNRLYRQLDQIKNNSCIIQLVDDMNLTSTLLIDGSVETSNRKRMFADPGTTAYSVEMSRAANSLVQFAKAQSIEQPITQVFVGGVSPQDLEIYQSSIGNVNENLSASGLPAGNSLVFAKGTTSDGVPMSEAFSNYAMALGGLVKTETTANVLTQMKYTPEQLEARAKKKRMLIPGITVVGILAVVSLVLFGRKLLLQKQLDELTAYNQNPQVIQDCAEYENANSRLNAANGIAGGLQGLQDTIAEYPKVNSGVNAVIEACAQGLVTVDLNGYSSADGSLSLQTTAANVTQINQFIDRLLAEQTLVDVDYTGYSQGADNSWTVNVKCRLAPEKTEEETEETTETEGTEETAGTGETP